MLPKACRGSRVGQRNLRLSQTARCKADHGEARKHQTLFARFRHSEVVVGHGIFAINQRRSKFLAGAPLKQELVSRSEGQCFISGTDERCESGIQTLALDISSQEGEDSCGSIKLNKEG